MLNPFVVPERAGADGRPLCPWETSAHQDLYAPVDHSQEAFLKFCEYIRGDSEIQAGGKVALITGPEGCGKTALMHRCAWFAKQFFESRTPPLDIHIVNLTSDGLTGADTLARQRHICSRLLDELQFLLVVDDSEFSGLDRRSSDPAKFYPYLSGLLRGKETAVLVLLPPSEVVDEVQRYASLSQRMILFFCESSYDSVASVESAPGGKPIAHFQLGLLEESDGWSFVNHRLARAAAQGLTVPSIDEATILNFMQTRIRGRGKTTIRELQMACENVFEAAIKAASGQVEYSDFTQYYAEKAFLS